MLEPTCVRFQRVVGQTQAVNAVANAIRIQRAGLNEGKKPLGAFLFLGSSGQYLSGVLGRLPRYLMGSFG